MDLLYLVGVNEVFGAYDTTVGDDLGSIELLFAQSWSSVAVDVAVMIRSYLYEVEGNVALLEIAAPLSHKVSQSLGVLTVWVAHVRAALIEEDALHGAVEYWVEGAVAPKKWIEKVPFEFIHHVCGV